MRERLSAFRKSKRRQGMRHPHAPARLCENHLRLHGALLSTICRHDDCARQEGTFMNHQQFRTRVGDRRVEVRDQSTLVKLIRYQPQPGIHAGEVSRRDDNLWSRPAGHQPRQILRIRQFPFDPLLSHSSGSLHRHWSDP